MNRSVIIDQLIAHEGFRSNSYSCSAGRTTVGYGRNLTDVGITKEEALILLDNDIATATEDLEKLLKDSWKLPEIVQRVLVDMRVNLGPKRFRGFKKMIKAVEKKDFYQAAMEMQDSKWFGQVGKRGETLSNMMLKAI